MGQNGSDIIYVCKRCRGVSVRAKHAEPIVHNLVAERLARADAVELLKAEQHDAAEAEQLRAEVNSLLAEIDNIAMERADGLLTGRQAKLATDRLEGRLEAVQARQRDAERVRVFDGIPLGTDAAPAAVAALSPDRFRAVLDVLAEVTVEPKGKSGNRFDPARVQVTWR